MNREAALREIKELEARIASLRANLNTPEIPQRSIADLGGWNPEIHTGLRAHVHGFSEKVILLGDKGASDGVIFFLVMTNKGVYKEHSRPEGEIFPDMHIKAVDLRAVPKTLDDEYMYSQAPTGSVVRPHNSYLVWDKKEDQRWYSAGTEPRSNADMGHQLPHAEVLEWGL